MSSILVYDEPDLFDTDVRTTIVIPPGLDLLVNGIAELDVENFIFWFFHVDSNVCLKLETKWCFFQFTLVLEKYIMSTPFNCKEEHN